MMNQYYGFTARGGRDGHDRTSDRGFDRSPYRRSMGRSGMPDRGMYPYGIPGSPRQEGGCGCGMMQNSPRPFGRGNGEESRRQNRTAPAMTQNGCGCGNHNHHDHDHNCNCNGNGNINVNLNGNGHHSHDHGNGCGHSCPSNHHTACSTLMDQIRAVDFALYETVLYLDVYPHSCDALETYHKLKAQSKALHEEYETACGPLTAFGNRSTASWDWMSNPCPWEYDAD